MLMTIKVGAQMSPKTSSGQAFSLPFKNNDSEEYNNMFVSLVLKKTCLQ